MICDIEDMWNFVLFLTDMPVITRMYCLFVRDSGTCLMTLKLGSFTSYFYIWFV